MSELRSKVRALHLSGMDADMVVDLIIDVVARGLGKLGGRPQSGSTATSISPGPARASATAATQASLGFEVSEPVIEPRETSDLTVSGSESALILSPLSGPSKTLSLGDRRSDEPLPPGFADFWALFPRRVGKADAVKAWRKHQPPVIDVRNALIWQIDDWDRESPPRPIEKIPHPATWLNGRRWLDERPEPRRLTATVSTKSRTQIENLMAMAERGRHRDDQK